MEPMLAEQHFRRLTWSLAISVGVSFGAILYGTSILITSSAAGAEFSIALLSTAFSGSVLTGAGIAIPTGRYVDRHGARAVTALGGLLVMVGFFAFSLSVDEWQVIASWWLLIGPGSAMVLFEPAFVMIQQWFSRSLRNRAAGTLTVITGLAGPIFIPATTYLVGQMGWRMTAALLGLTVCLVTCVVAGWALRIAPRTVIENPLAANVRTEAKRRAFPPGFIPLTISVALTMAVLESYNVHRIARFEATGFGLEVLAVWAALVGLLSLPARFLIPLLANHYDSARIWVWLTVLIMPAVLLSIRGTSNAEMIGHFLVFGLLFGAFMPLRAVVMSDWFGGARFGALMGAQAMAIALGRAGGPAIVGWLASSPSGYPAAMTLLAALLFLSLLFTLLAMKRQPRISHRQLDDSQ